jgi:hypothetical protein
MFLKVQVALWMLLPGIGCIIMAFLVLITPGVEWSYAIPGFLAGGSLLWMSASMFQHIYREMSGPATVKEAPPEFSQPDPPDWLLAARVGFLPYGGGGTVRASLHASPPRGTIQVDSLPGPRSREPRSERIELTPEGVGKLLDALTLSFPKRFRTVSSEVVDGMPCELTVSRRSPLQALTAECNLGDWIDPAKQDIPAQPVLFLAGSLFDAARSVWKGHL